jgi:hypothetical protein
VTTACLASTATAQGKMTRSLRRGGPHRADREDSELEAFGKAKDAHDKMDMGPKGGCVVLTM